MTKLYRIFKKQLIMAVVLLCVNLGFAQNPTVLVPAGITVVQAGTGGVTGTSTSVPPGRVGDGGLVTMTDPYAGGVFTFQPNNTTSPLVTNTVGTWILRGDLSSNTLATNLFNAPVQIVGTPLTATIKSYNKLLRTPSENTSPSVSSWARSKGRISIQYTKTTSTAGTGCGNSISFDVLKVFAPNAILPIQPTNVPNIIGPRCVKKGLTYTYSVDQIVSDNLTDGIGLDNYYWTGMPTTPGTTFYTSADKSSITIKISATATFAPFTLKCCYGRANPWDSNAAAIPTTCVSLGIVQEVQEPKVSLPCVKIGDNAFSASVDPAYVTANPGTTYQWATVGSNWTLTNPTSPNLVGTLPITDYNPCVLTLTVNNNICAPATVYTYTIFRDFVSPLKVLSYPSEGASECLTPNTSSATTLQYSISASGLDNPTVWTISPNVANGLSIVGSANATGSIVNLSLPNAANAVPGAYTLTALPKNCNGSSGVSIVLNIQPKAPQFTSTTPTCVPLSSPTALTTFAVAAVTGATSYTWTLPSGWSCTGNCTTTNPSLLPPLNTSAVGAAAPVFGTIKVKANGTNGCNSGLSSIDVNYIRITTNVLVEGAGQCDQYSVNTGTPCLATGTPIATFTVGGTQAISNGTTVNIFGNTLTLCGSTAPAAQGVCANVVVGGITYTTCSSTVATGSHGLRQAASDDNGIKDVIEGVVIAPNPNSGSFSITVTNIKEDSAQAILFDFSGNEIGTYTLHQGENKIQKEGLTKGTYIVLLLVDGKKEARQIIIK